MTLAPSTFRNNLPATDFQESRFKARNWGLLFAVIMTLLTGSGCSRTFWRQHADRETYAVLAQKMTDERWVVPDLDLEPDPRSRFYDPYDRDKPPLPPDDPDAHQYMQWMHGMFGYKGWHKFGGTLTVENPQWLENFGISAEEVAAGYENGYSYSAQTSRPVPKIEKLTMGDAVELTYIHSRDFQFQLEELFLTSLELTFQRFRYDVQFLGIGGNKPSSDVDYQAGPAGQTSVGWDNRIGVSKLLPSGGQWAVELANNTLWLFSGDNKTNTASALSFSLVQPLLLGGGRKVALEGLTQAERDALYAMREFARFRKIFFVDVVGRNGGYLGLLGLRQEIINQESNIRAIEEQVKRLRALSEERPQWLGERLEQLPAGLEFPDSVAENIRYEELTKNLSWRGVMSREERDLLLGLSNVPEYQLAIRELYQRTTGEVTPLEVAQLETDLAEGRSNLLSRQVDFQDSLDSYKIQMGLPTDALVTTDESLLEQFQLIDPRLDQLQRDLDELLNPWSEIDDEDPEQQTLQSAVDRLVETQKAIETEAVGLIVEDFKKLESIWDRRMNSLESEEDRDRLSRDVARDRQIFESLRADLRLALEKLNIHRDVFQQAQLPQAQRANRYRDIAELREELLRIVQGFKVVQINIRVELIVLPEVNLTITEGVQLGMENRLDLKNQQALVMDSRRKLEVAANRLEAVLDVVVEGDLRTPPLLSNNNPLDFRGRESNIRAGLAFTAPVVQIRERNLYRAALIEYQRARRAYMEAEDQTKREIRNNWRGLMADKARFEIARQGVRSAAIQFDQSVDRSVAPGENRSASSIGLNLLNSLNAILRAQNNLIQVWVAYENDRLQLYRDMGVMEIDETGVWTDPYYQERKAGRGDYSGHGQWVPPAPPAGDENFTLELFEHVEPNSEPGLPLDGPQVIPPDETAGTVKIDSAEQQSVVR